MSSVSSHEGAMGGVGQERRSWSWFEWRGGGKGRGLQEADAANMAHLIYVSNACTSTTFH